MFTTTVKEKRYLQTQKKKERWRKRVKSTEKKRKGLKEFPQGKKMIPDINIDWSKTAVIGGKGDGGNGWF